MDNLQKRLCMNFQTAFPALIILCLTIYPQQTQTKFRNDAPLLSNCWLYRTDEDESEVIKLASDNETNFFLSHSNGKLLSLNSETIEKLWETNLGGNIVSNMLVDKTDIYVTIQKQGKLESENAERSMQENSIRESMRILYSLNRTTGITSWQVKIAESDKVYLYDTGDSVTIILSSGVAFSLAKANGKILWTRSLESNLSARPLKKTTEIILGTVDKQITYLSLKDGKTLQKFEIDEQSAVIAEDTNGSNLIIGDRKGIVRSLNKKKRKRNWSFRQGAEISNLLLNTQRILISSFDNFIYLVSETGGKLIWKKRLAGRIAAEPQIKGNNIIINSVDESTVLVLELNSGKLVNKIILEGDNFFTGESIQSNNLLIYATRRGVFSFSLGEGCPLQKNRL